VTLEDVKSGMIHLELTWFSLMDDPVMLKMVILKFLLIFKKFFVSSVASIDFSRLSARRWNTKHGPEFRTAHSVRRFGHVSPCKDHSYSNWIPKLDWMWFAIVLVCRAPGHLQNPILMWSWLQATVVSKLQLGCVLAILLGSKRLSSSSAILNQMICTWK
jgi:hypothetical protein